GSVKLDLGDFSGARYHLEKSIELSRKMNFRRFESQVYAWLAMSLMSVGDFEGAREAAVKAVQLGEELNQRDQLAAAKRAVGIVELAFLIMEEQGVPSQERRSAVEGYLTDSMKMFEELQMKQEIGRCCLELAKFY